MTDRAITLHQPWAQLIRDGRKTIETRSWSTEHRGPLSIHAGKKIDVAAAYQHGYTPDTLDLGAHIAIVNLVAVAPTETLAWTTIDNGAGPREWTPLDHPHLTALVHQDQLRLGDFSDGRYAWLLDDIEPIDPVRARGRQGIWRVNT